VNLGIGIQKPCGCWVEWLSPATDTDYLNKRLERARLLGNTITQDVDVDAIVVGGVCPHRMEGA
jgi:hypothetical protein